MASHSGHLVQSHAKEGDVPGTVNLRAAEGDDTAFGQALFPVPAEDPNDPLQWPSWKKTSILIICSLYSFFSNTALLGPSVYIGIYAEQFGITPTKASGLISYPNILYGVGTLITVPMYLKFGRRPVMLLSMVVYLAGLIGCSRANSYGGLMTARLFHTLSSGVCEALPVQLVNDIFFLHERATKLGIYTICLCLGSTGPLYAGYMLAGGNSWRLYFYVEIGFAAALLILAFFFVEESSYKRDGPLTHIPSQEQGRRRIFGQKEPEKEDGPTHIELQTSVPPRKTFIETLKPWSTINHDEQFFLTAIRSFTYFLVPSVVWVVCTYGIFIGLGALVFNYTFPILITAPPYGWSQENSGLIAVGSVLGYFLAAPLIPSFDRLAAYLTRRNDDIREAEMRLGVLLPAAFVAPAGLIVYGMTAEDQLHWVGYFAGVAMCNWGAYFFFTGTLAYAVDSYNANVSEMLIAMCVGKQLISFGFGEKLLDWVATNGYAVIIAGVFCGVLFANNLCVFIFMFFGKRIRRFIAGTALARMHKKTIREIMAH
ncbi:putative MFS-type transporter [Pseudocercospora fuligena]|uniref:Putative MFS-type transporter n=1 Tax=Pseudocercospora fuligena TaxID=685502 RepID=A0A8H6VJV8_9PEZI|nr:putative MFS-type transporter [Pseudocercospora fuligena]